MRLACSINLWLCALHYEEKADHAEAEEEENESEDAGGDEGGRKVVKQDEEDNMWENPRRLLNSFSFTSLLAFASSVSLSIGLRVDSDSQENA